jgi:hypothetical protein
VKRPLVFTLAVVAALALVACSDDDGGGGGSVTPAPAARTTNAPPKVDSLMLPDWPPLGPNGAITVRCTDDDRIAGVSAMFLRQVRKAFTPGPDVSVSFTAAELGEGIGTFRATCEDSDRVTASRTITNLLVDLHGPVIEPARVVASPNVDGLEGAIGIWVKDAWVLGSVELEYAGKKLTKELPQKYPDTLGKEWDVTYVAYSAKELGAGSGQATVTARDAAGNETKQAIAIRIDATPPAVAILAPASGATVSGNRLAIRVSSSDAQSTTPTSIHLLVGGAPVGDFVGPLAEIVVDTSAFPSGPTEVRAVAHDDAGNEAVSQTVVVEVP